MNKIDGHDHDHDHDHDHGHSHNHEHPVNSREVLRIIFVCIAAVIEWAQIWDPFASISVVGVIATIVGGYPVFKHAIQDVLRRRMTMELSMTIALFAALLIGEFLTVLVIIFFVLVAEVLEGLTVGRGRRAIKNLLEFLPRTVLVRREGAPCDVSADDLVIGDTVIIKPGSRIPVDGDVIKGHSFVDQATITGESLPVEKVTGTVVYAGTINQSGALEVKATKIGRDTIFGKIIEEVESAEKNRAPIQKTADRFAGYLVYFALACAVLTFLITRDVRSTISVIIVAGACGIAAGTPLAILGAIGRAARQGAIVKGGIHLEVLWGVDTVVLDKTGTLTYGDTRVVALRPAAGISEERLLSVAATAERPTEHPLGKAILEYADAHGIQSEEPERFEYIPGRGIRCDVGDKLILVGSREYQTGNSIVVSSENDSGTTDGSEVHVSLNGEYLGVIQVADTLRPEAAEAIRQLRNMNARTILLTGDVSSIAEPVGKELGVDEVGAGLLPEEKAERVKELLAQGRTVAMVGDGINDAPALTQSSVGIAMGSGTEVAQESARVILLGNDLLKLVDLFKVARRCHRIIRMNFAGTLIVDGIGVGLAAFGLLNPMIAALIHVSSELVFILNSARLLPRNHA